MLGQAGTPIRYSLLPELFGIVMILGQLHKQAAAIAEGLAVPQIADIDLMGTEQGHHCRAAHVPHQFQIRSLHNGPVHGIAGIQQEMPLRNHEIIQKLHLFLQGSGCQKGCGFSVFRTAHAVKHTYAHRAIQLEYRRHRLFQAGILHRQAPVVKKEIIFIITPDFSHITAAGCFQNV